MWRQLNETLENLTGWRRFAVVFGTLFLVAFISGQCLQLDTDWYGGLEERTVVVFVSSINWNEQEMDRIYQGLTRHSGAETIVTSTVRRMPVLQSRYDGPVSFRPLEDLSAREVDAAIFVGGAGVRHHFGEASLQGFIRELADRKRILAAVGSGTALLSDAGVAGGRELVVPRNVRDKVEEDGAVVVGGRVHSDEYFVTASPGSERELLREVVASVQERLGDPER